MSYFRRAALLLILVPLAIATTGVVRAIQPAQGAIPQAAAGTVAIAQELRDRAQRDGRVRMIVRLNLSFAPEGALPATAAVLRQRDGIAATQAKVLSRLPAGDYRVTRTYVTLPYLALEAGSATLSALENASSDVFSVTADAILRHTLAQSVPIVQGDQVWQAGYDGTGSVIAILDTGVDSTHPFLAGKVIEEACYSSTVPGTSQSFCPNGQSQQIGPGSAVPCSLPDCLHGTHVAGIAAGNGATGGVPFSGVAKGAQLMAVQVFSEIIDATDCGGTAPCAGAFSSDLIAGLERVYTVAFQRNITSANMSLGGGQYSAPCDTDPSAAQYKPPIDNLRAIGIASTIASANSGATNAISAPACISSAVSVGSTDKTDEVSWFSNVAPFLSLFAPGDSITSSIPGGGYEALSGTSMAAPHVAGAWGLLKQAKPGASVTQILTALQQTGLPITDTRFLASGTVTIPRIRIFQALAALVPVTNPPPSIASLSPDHAMGGIPLTLTISGSGFDAFSVVRWNGAPKPTSVASTTQIVASIPASDLPAAGGTAQVTVFTPTPGGGESAPLTVTITPAPVLAISAAAVAPGGQETMTLTNGAGGAQDWLSLAATGSPDSSFLQWTWVGAGVTTRTWTVTMPSTAGTYEFRLFLNNGSTHVAVSAPVTVDPTLNPAPAASSLSPAFAGVGGSAFTLTVNGSRFVSSSVVRWNGANRPTTFISATQLQAAIGASDLATTGTAQVTVFTPAPGGGTSASLPFTVMTPPVLTPTTPTTATGGSSFTTTLTNGVGGSTDWIALAATTASATSYVQWTYVGAGVTTRTWTVTLPSAAGTYEFRLFLNNSYTITARSAPITVSGGVPTLTSLSPTTQPVGGPAFTLTVNGTGFAASSVVQWNGANRPTTFISATQLQAAIGAADLAVAATVPITVTTPGNGTSASLPFTVMTPPVLTPTTPTTATGGSSFTTTLTSGVGGSTDWIALAATTASATSYVQWTYVGAGVTTRTWTVTLPSTAGTYEFRLFLNNSYTITARSAAITVSGGVPTLTSLSPTSQPVGSAAFTLTVNGTGFAASSFVQWNGASRPTTFISATQLQAAIGAADLAVAATVPITVTTPGGGTSASLPFAVMTPPSLTANTYAVAPGGSVTVTLTNGLGGATDWLALAATGAGNTTYLQWTYVGNGVTTRMWTVTMPATPGTYEFRYFPNNSFTRLATSPPVTVAQ